MNNVMDLFAGIGGATYAGKLIGDWRTVCYVEIDPFCQRVIRQRIRDEIFDDAPIWGDITTFDGKPWAGSVDIITAGFPCQPFSVAGQRRGEDDERNMWPETLRVIDEVRPRFAFLENVPGLISSGYFDRIIGDLTEIGYDCRWTIVSAADVGAPHERKRLWILAYPSMFRCFPELGETGNGGQEKKVSDTKSSCGGSRGNSLLRTSEMAWWDIDPADLSNAECERLYEGYVNKEGQVARYGEVKCSNGTIKPILGRVAHGIPDRINKLKSLGNAWVPLVAATAWGILNEEG